MRYDIKAFILAELARINFLNISEVMNNSVQAVKYLKIGLADCFDSLGLSESERSEITSELIKSTDVFSLMQTATVAALPKPVVGNHSNDSDKKPVDMSKLYGLFVDVMGREEKEFFGLTLREVLERWDNFAVFNGYKKAPQQFKEFDDD